MVPFSSGDLNGDGKAGVFMWRDVDKTWSVNLSTGTGFTGQTWRGAWGSDGPINAGDLNGDGKADVFMWRDADKSWTVNLSPGSPLSFGMATGVPMARSTLATSTAMPKPTSSCGAEILGQ
jgi:FG-GAP-like repeat